MSDLTEFWIEYHDRLNKEDFQINLWAFDQEEALEEFLLIAGTDFEFLRFIEDPTP